MIPRCTKFQDLPDLGGAPGRIKSRTHTQLKLLVIFPAPNGSTAVGVEFGLTRCHFRHASQQRAPFHFGIVVLSSGPVDALRPRISNSIAVQAIALEEMHSRNKQMIATAVGQHGKWRTLWRGVTIKPGQP